MNLLQRLRGERHAETFSFNGTPHALGQITQTMSGASVEEVRHSFSAYVDQVHSRQGVVAAAATARCLLMSQLRFKWRNLSTDRLFGTQALRPLEDPAFDLTRPSLLWQIENDAIYAGNAYVLRTPTGTRRLRPDWVRLALATSGSLPPSEAPDARIAWYIYQPGGPYSGKPAQRFMVDDIAHFAPEPHPLKHFIGESPVTSILREITNDSQSTEYVSAFFDHAATANMVVKAPPGIDEEQFRKWVTEFKRVQEGVGNAWTNLYVSEGVDVDVVGSDLAGIDMKNIAGHFETRIASRLRVPATVLGIREGMQGSALNAGNYGQTRRLWSDGWFTPHTAALCASLQRILAVPAGAELSHDPGAVMFLQEDRQDEAKIVAEQAQAIRTLHDAGFEPDATIAAVVTSDLRKLTGSHTGLSSVQLTPPDTSEEAPSVA